MEIFADPCSDWFKSQTPSKGNPTPQECCHEFAKGVFATGGGCHCPGDRIMFDPRLAFSCVNTHQATCDGRSQNHALVMESFVSSCGKVAEAVSESGSQWNTSIWKERSRRPVKPLDARYLSILENSGDEEIVYLVPGHSTEYRLAHSKANQNLTVLASYRYSAQEPAFRIQHAMLQELAQRKARPVQIKEIIRNRVSNLETLAFIFDDVPDLKQRGRLIKSSSLEELEFFKSVNGRNTLDLIKALKPEVNPFSLMDHVEFRHYRADGRIDVIISLKEELRVIPFGSG